MTADTLKTISEKHLIKGQYLEKQFPDRKNLRSDQFLRGVERTGYAMHMARIVLGPKKFQKFGKGFLEHA